MRTAHTKFGCTAPTGNRVMALCYFQIYIVDSPDSYLGNGFSDFIVILQEYVLAYEDSSHQGWLHCKVS